MSDEPTQKMVTIRWCAILVYVCVLVAKPAPATEATDVVGTGGGCRPITGVEALLEPGKVILLGELHGTAQSPAFLLDLACHAVLAELSVTVGLELSPGGQAAVDAFLDSEGGATDRAALVAGETWQRDYQDGRNSQAVAELIDGLRVLRREGGAVKIVLFDFGGGHDRDARMAGNLAELVAPDNEGISLVLTGNRHSRVTDEAGSPPMGYVLSQAVGVDRVVSLDVAHSGGTAWLCFATTEGQQCGEVRLRSRGPEGAEGSVILSRSIGSNLHHGWYGVGEIEASPPARIGFSPQE